MLKNKWGVFFAIPFYREPKCSPFVSSLKGAVKLFKDNGYQTHAGVVAQDSFVQRARNKLVKQFLETDCDVLLFLDDDMSWNSEDLLRLIETPGKIVASVYRLKVSPDKTVYPDGINKDKDGYPVVRKDGCISAWGASTGFMKVERSVFERLIKAYPEQEYYGKKGGNIVDRHYDLFPQGVYNKQWLGEDYSFCRLWTNIGGKIWVMPDVNIVHYSKKDAYPGNYHEYLKSLPGGINGHNSSNDN